MSTVIERKQITEELEGLAKDHFVSFIVFYDVLNKLFHNYSIDAYPSKEPKHRKVHQKSEVGSKELKIANECLELLLNKLAISTIYLGTISEGTNFASYLADNYTLLNIVFKALDDVLNTSKMPRASINVNEVLAETFFPES
jgi:hypothetical protein